MNLTVCGIKSHREVSLADSGEIVCEVICLLSLISPRI
jgi:hypothetical protein